MDGFVLVYSDAEEIQEFIDGISKKRLKDFLNKPKAEDLFKD
jgi:hypothetical protein